jgi:pilus assembly protein CpaC
LRRRSTVVRALSLMLALAGIAGGGIGAAAQGSGRDAWLATEPGHKAQLVLPPGTRFPVSRKITLGLDKSMLVELSVDLQNVLVSNPEILDAVVQSSRQVYLLAKDAGDANAIFLGPDGQKLLFLEVTVARDLTPLADALTRLLPGSRIRVEAVGDNIVLTGSVLHPIDANRAGEIASRYTSRCRWRRCSATPCGASASISPASPCSAATSPSPR